MKIDDTELSLEVGETSSKAEKRKMYSLRYKVYSDNNYINPNECKNNLENDDYDNLKSTRHYIAKVNNTLIGTARTISDQPLPTLKVFDFKEPDIMQDNSNKEPFEIGRLIIKPYDKERQIHPPKGMTLVFLFEAILEDAISEDRKGGYAFIKDSLRKKLENRGVPFHKIKNYDRNLDKENKLYKYFTQKNDPVIPVYFLVSEVKKYIRNITSSRIIFKHISDRELQLRTWSYKVMQFFS